MRPSPASRRRRASQTSNGGSEGQQSPKMQPYIARSTSGPNIHGVLSSPGQDRRSDSSPSSPLSPVNTGFDLSHGRAKSPLGDEADPAEAEQSLGLDGQPHFAAEDSELDDEFDELATDSRMARISVSYRSTHACGWH